MSGPASIATRQIADLLGGGLPLLRSLDIVATQTSSGPLREALIAVRRDVESGQPVSTALAARNGFFSPVYVGLVRAGESTGALETAFDEAARHLELEDDLRQRARQAMVYPCVVLFLAAAVGLFVAAFVVPRFQLLFDDLGQRLPLPTRLLIGASSVLRRDGLILAAVIGAVALAAPDAFANIVRRTVARLLTLAPVRQHLAPRFAERWSQVMAALIRGGFPVSEALGLTRRSLEPNPIAGSLVELESSVSEGASLSRALKTIAFFPTIVTELVAAGEEAGSLEASLERAARALGRESDASLRLAMSLLEPALILVMAAIVGFVALAMLLPIFEMSANVR